jgi:hypothetical protein
MTQFYSLLKGSDRYVRGLHPVLFSMLLLFPFFSFAQMALTCSFSADKEYYCPGDIATITIRDSYIPNQAGTYDIWTEDLRTESQHCSGVGCTVLREIQPVATGDGIISCEVIERRLCGYEQWKINTVQIKVMVTKTTSISISWDAKWYVSRDIPCGRPEDELMDHRSYSGTYQIKCIDKDPPQLNPASLVMNLGDQPQYIKASAYFFTNDRAFRFFTTNCNQTVMDEYKFYQGNEIWHSVAANKLGTYQYRVMKVDNNCISDPAHATAIVKPCATHKDGCNQEQVDFIDSKSCDPGAGIGRNDHHLYNLEKSICTGCDINDVWQKYKADVHNQAIVLSDQFFVFGRIMPDARSLPIPEFLMPDKKVPQPITDCATLDLPRLTTYLLKLGLVVAPNITNVFKKIQEACSLNPYSYTDPIFLRVNENARCVTNYTKPGHALYPGKVTRCIVQDCDTVKILTFGEGATVFPNTPCGKLLATMNDFWGSSMFTNVDNRAYDYIRFFDEPKQQPKQENARSVVLTADASPFLSNKVWRIKSMEMEYDGLDSVYNFYSFNDTANFFNLRAVNIRFNSNGKTSGTNIDGAETESNWSYDESTHMLTTDTTSMEILPLTENSFSISGILPVFKDTSVVRGRYTFTFASDLAALPVRFGAVKAQAKNCKVDLTWTMHTDDPGTINYVERRKEKDWLTIASLPAGKDQNFQFTDIQPLSGLNEYRIRSVETNGEITYSRIVTSVNKCSSGGIAVYPNPVSNQLSVSVPAGWEQSVITIVNAQGQLKYSGRLHTGENFISTISFPSGVYFLKVMHNNKELYHRAIIKK